MFSKLVSFCFVILTLPHRELQSQRLDRTDLVISENTASNDDEAEVAEEDDEVINDVFVPSHEWKRIEKGQAVPAGLHIRLNLQTGEREAKLLDSDEEEREKPIETEQEKIPSESEPKLSKYSPEMLKKLLKKIKSDDGNTTLNVTESNATFRDINEIKSQFKKLNMVVKTDAEIIEGLMTSFREPNATDKDRIAIMTELEYYLHQYDNALDFVHMGGLQMISPLFNSTNQEIKILAIFLIGSASQSNAKVQFEVLSSGILDHLLRILAFDTAKPVLMKTVFALSTLIRNFPIAQRKMVESGGVTVLMSLFRPSSTISDNKLRLKIITLVNDLIEEQEIIELQVSSGGTEQSERIEAHKIGLKKALLSSDWCSSLLPLLKLGSPDMREQVVKSMLVFSADCRHLFTDHLKEVKHIINQYRMMADREAKEDKDHMGYYQSMYDMFVSLVKRIEERDEL